LAPKKGIRAKREPLSQGKRSMSKSGLKNLDNCQSRLENQLSVHFPKMGIAKINLKNVACFSAPG
jgi:hypothetical protein